MLIWKHIWQIIVIGISVAFWTLVFADKVIKKWIAVVIISDTVHGHSWDLADLLHTGNYRFIVFTARIF